MSEKLIGSCIFGQSGGPTAVINASAYGVIKTALEAGEITRVYGASYGIKGVLADRLYVMDEEDPEELRLLLNTPSSELGSCRYKMADPEVDDTDYKRILEIFRKYDVRYFFYNGGNDSMDTCNKISRYMESVGYPCRVIGVPKTVDNDLNGTDHCPGFGSAAKLIATTCMEICKDTNVYDNGVINVVRSWDDTPAGLPPVRPWPPHTVSDRIWCICRRWILTWTGSSVMWTGSTGKKEKCW